MPFERLNDLGKAGFLVGLIGGLLALVPALESLFRFPAAWQEPMVLTLLSVSMVTGAMLAVSDSIALSGVVTAVVGLTIAVYGPTAPGILGVVGGALLYTASEEQKPASTDETGQQAQERRPSPMARR